jgi:hypothetical protein
MSIIQEALKKVQRTTSAKIKNTGPAHIPYRKDASEGDIVKGMLKPRKKKNAMPGIIVKMIVYVLAAAVIAAAFFISLSAWRKARPMVIAGQDEIPAQEVTYRPMSNIEIKGGYIAGDDRPELILNGIMYLGQGNSKAIINNAIVMESDTVKGARIMRINERNVVLEYKDTEITLRLR